MISRKFVCGSLYKELFLMNLRPCIFNKIIYEHWPGSLLVIIRHIIIDRQAKIKQEVPSILRYGSFMILLKNKNIFFTNWKPILDYLYLKNDVISHSMPDNFKKYIQTQEKKHLWNKICNEFQNFWFCQLFFLFEKICKLKISWKKFGLNFIFNFLAHCFETLVLYVVE